MSKIALCFLTYGNLSQPKLWYDIIETYKNKYNVYIHNKIDFECEYNLNKYIINNKIPTKHGDISLVKATLLLFKASFENTENKYYILLSDKCIPIKDMVYIYKYCFTKNSTLFALKHNNHERYTKMILDNFIDCQHFYKTSQWMIVKRSECKFFIENDYTNYFQGFAPDENYFISLCEKYKLHYLSLAPTFVNWSENSDDINIKKLPKTYDILTNDIIKDIIKSGEYLFMRKISHKCILPSFYNNFTLKIDLQSNQNLPLDFDVNIYKEINPKYNDFTDNEIYEHYTKWSYLLDEKYKYEGLPYH